MSRKQFAFGFALVVFAAAVGAVIASGSTDFANMSEEWEKAYNAKDAAAVAALYAEDGTVMPPNQKGAQGRAAIEAVIKADMATIPGVLDIVTVEHESSGNMGFARGTYTVTGDNGTVVDSGKWVEVRKKVKGSWHIVADIWNSDNPAM